MTPTISSTWSLLCPVDVAAAVAWLADNRPPFPEPSTPDKPQRVWNLPLAITQPIVDTVLLALRAPHVTINMATDALCLSRMLPGQNHGLHVDIQRSDSVTRVHVPLTTNPGCWMQWEVDSVLGDRVHFEVGHAYSFDTLQRHAFGNDGTTERVHLLFDVLRV